MKLLHSATSPYARKVRIVAAEKKLDLDLEPVDPWSADATIARTNPLGKVPALIMDDGQSLFDSRVIVEYLDGLSPVHRLIPDGSRDRIASKRWEAIADGLCDAAILARLEGNRPDQNASSAKQIDRQRSKVIACLDEMARELGEREYCVGNALTLADIATGCALGYLKFRFPDITWEVTHPNLARLYRKLAARPSFKATDPTAA
ncbi:MAG: glutathione S-transferase N-terminal domain-containing protein [Burkholderiales bacterium]|nr:glutathione S-transferase N-terminal domain-containing protein [Burkholderiales bacterium]